LILTVATQLAGEAWVSENLMPAIFGWAGPRGTAALKFLLEQTKTLGTEHRASVGILGFIGLFLGVSQYFSALQDSLLSIWDVRREEAGTLVQIVKRLRGLLSGGVSAIIALGGLSAGALVLALDRNRSGGLSHWAYLAAQGTIGFLTFWALEFWFLKVFLPVRIAWQRILPWAALIAALHLLGKLVLNWHFAAENAQAAIDVGSSLIIVILWFFYSSMVFLYGAEMMRVYYRRLGGPFNAAEGGAEAPAPTPS